MDNLVQGILTYLGAPGGVIAMSVFSVMALGAAYQQAEEKKHSIFQEWFFVVGVVLGIFALWGAYDWLRQ